MKSVLDVARIHSLTWWWLLVWPLVFLAITLAINVGLFGSFDSDSSGGITGALVSIYFIAGGSHLQSMTQLFAFAVGISITRRAFYAGTALVIAGQAAVLGLVLLLMAQLESLTGGWGVGVAFFGLPFLPLDNPLALWLAYTVPFLAISAVAGFMGVVFKRWGQTGIYVALIGGAVLLSGAAMLVTWQRWWPAVGTFFTDQPPLALLAGYPMLIAVVLGGMGWLAIRRATP